MVPKSLTNYQEVLNNDRRDTPKKLLFTVPSARFCVEASSKQHPPPTRFLSKSDTITSWPLYSHETA